MIQAKPPTARAYVRESRPGHSNIDEIVLIYRHNFIFGNIFGEICSLQQKNDPERDDHDHRIALSLNWNAD